ncbi:MAG TPA: hypothetical protein VI454_02480 [Verrucomicrobiae bacterium]|jgi:T5SS/PEP-CTERM-associated repeat protein
MGLPVLAQLVPDGGTNVVDGVSIEVGVTNYIGSNAPYSLLVVTNGGVLSNLDAVIGLTALSTNNTALVTGAGSTWIANGALLVVGAASGFNQLLVNRGGTMKSGTAALGFDSTSAFNTAVVSDSGSTWNLNGALTIGQSGGGNTLVISNGGSVASPGCTLGLNPGANSNLVVVTGTGSVLSNSGPLTIGHAGAFNSLLVSNGGALRVGGLLTVGNSATASNNSLVATGASISSVGLLVGGVNLLGNTVSLMAGTTWDLGGGNLPWFTSGSNDVIHIDSTSVMTNIGSLQLDGVNTEFFLTNQVGGYVLNGFDTNHLGFRPAGLAVLSVGNSGTNVHLTISNYTIVTQTGSIGLYAAALSNSVFVTGSGAAWRNSGQLVVGGGGDDNQLEISNGGIVTGASADIGTLPYGYYSSKTGSSNRVVVTGAGSVWSNSAGIRVGAIGGFGPDQNQMIISNRGTVYSGGGTLGGSSGSSANVALVVGDGSVWKISGGLTNGLAGPNNRLIVSNAGTVFSTTAIVGYGSTNNVALVTGSGSTWSNSGSLTVGYQGPRSQLLVSDGGTVFAASLAIGTTAYSTDNLVRNDGGQIIITSTSGTGILNVQRGTFAVAGGGVTWVDRVSVANTGVLEGIGVIGAASVTNFGTITPGSPVGALTLASRLGLTGSARLTFEIAGLIPTNQYDVLNVTGPVELGGALNLSLTNRFYPSAVTMFTLFNFPSATGNFTNVATGGRLNTTDNLGSFLVTLSATNLVVGDYTSPDSDNDGLTDYAEYLAGTDLHDVTSVLKILLLTFNNAGQPVMRFPFVVGRNYRIRYTDDLSSSVWGAVDSPMFTTPLTGFYEWTDDGTQTGGLASPTRFYRVELQ